jgi:hypothetical protein
MNWVDGEPLDRWADAHPDATPQDCLELLLPVATALDLMHSGAYTGGVPLVHRDVKPPNHLVTPRGTVLVDTGLARGLPGGSASGAVGGTPGYIAPEVLDDGVHSPAADRYSFGLVAWRLLTRRQPPEQPTLAELAGGLEDAHPEEPRLTAHVLAMLDEDPNIRPARLANWCAQLGGSSLDPDSDPPVLAPLAPIAATQSRTRRPSVRGAVAIVAVVALIATGVAFAARDAPRRHERVLGVHYQRLAPSDLESRSATTRVTADNLAPPSPGAGVAASLPPTVPPSTARAAAPQPVPCQNAMLGYTVLLPLGWRDVGIGGPYPRCQILGRKRLPAVRDVDRTMDTADVVFTSRPGKLPAQVTDAVAVTVAGHRSWRIDEKLPGGGWGYSYAIDRGKTLLVASMLIPKSSTASVRRSLRATLDGMMVTLELSAVGCRDSFEPYCGQFLFDPDPAPNDYLVARVESVTPAEPHVGDTVHVVVAARDSDADVIELVSVDWFGVSVAGAVELENTGWTFLWNAARVFGSRDGSAYGPWTPPPELDSGVHRFEFTHVYESVGDFHPSFTFKSANSKVRSGMDPYSSNGSAQTTIAVR